MFTHGKADFPGRRRKKKNFRKTSSAARSLKSATRFNRTPETSHKFYFQIERGANN